jgi:hypothetical protein
LTAPYAHIVRTAANAYNFSDLLEGKKKEPAEKPLRFSLNNIIIANGSVDFIDQAIPVEKRHTVRRIGVGIPFISNIPYLADRYVIPPEARRRSRTPIAMSEPTNTTPETMASLRSTPGENNPSSAVIRSVISGTLT